jgi:hypothetical protein
LRRARTSFQKAQAQSHLRSRTGDRRGFSVHGASQRRRPNVSVLFAETCIAERCVGWQRDDARRSRTVNAGARNRLGGSVGVRFVLREQT